MSDTNEPLQRLVALVGGNTDALVGGTPAQARQLLAEAAVALADRATVVAVASPIGELSLSTLIAQLSGRLDLDDQDDAVLELGFKRLKGEGQTVLTVLAPTGIGRTALRYLQHVSRQSPRLAMAVHSTPSLAALLEEPAFAALRTRLHAAAAIEFEAPAPVLAPQPLAVIPPAPPSVVASAPVPVAPTKARRPMLWAASALSVAAAVGLFWLGRNAPGTAVAGSRTAHAEIPLVPAMVPPPALAGLSAPGTAASSVPILAMTSSPPLANPVRSAAMPPLRIALATLPAPLPALPLAHPETAVAGLGQPPLRTDRTPRRLETAKRDPSRLARARPYWSDSRYPAPAEYDSAPPWDGVSPIWVRRDARRGNSPYLGTYAVGPNGMRVFQYDP